MWTLLPLGYLIATRQLSLNTSFLISGALVPRSWEPIRRRSAGLCTVERYDEYDDATVARGVEGGERGAPADDEESGQELVRTGAGDDG